MDEVTKTTVLEMEDRTESPLDEIRKSQERIASLIVKGFGELRAQILETERRLSVRLDSIDSQLNLHAELIHNALLAVARFPRFTDIQSGTEPPRPASE